jgi:hypothetical protein
LKAITTFLPAFPRLEIESLGPRVQLFVLPGSQIRRLPKSDGLAAFVDETAWLAHGSSLCIKDKADYKLDDKMRALAPIAPGTAVSLPVKALPAKRLIAANIYDERKTVTKESFARGFDAAVDETIRHDGKTMTLFDPTSDWNYFEQRTTPDFAAELIGEGVVRNRKRLKVYRVVVVEEQYADAYIKRLNYLHENCWRFYAA